VAQNLFLVTVRWVRTPLTEENVKKVDAIMDGVGDWLRFSGTSWIVDTDKAAVDIFNMLSRFLHSDDSHLIIKLDLKDWSGWCPKWVDEWIKSKRKL
jgi:hypothetical protein